MERAKNRNQYNSLMQLMLPGVLICKLVTEIILNHTSQEMGEMEKAKTELKFDVFKKNK